MRPAIKMLLRVAAATVAAMSLCAALNAQLPPDQMTSLTMPQPGPNWIYVTESEFAGGLGSRVWILDGEKMKLLGQLSAGYQANFEISPDHREMYTIDTFYSRGWRGDRADVVSIFDARTTNFLAEVTLPPKRMLIVPKRNSASITADGRFLMVSNMTPATSISVVDLKTRQFVTEIDVPGCAQSTATGNRQFFSMCADGSLLAVTLDDSGKPSAKKQTKPLFDPNTDPMFDQPAISGARAYFVSCHGKLMSVDFSGADPVADTWSVLTPADTAKKWRRGGWQTISCQARGAIAYVLMHQGGEWTHKQFGTEIWAFDLASHKRTARIKLKTAAYSILAGQGDQPILFALDLLPSQVESYSPAGKMLGAYKDVGTSFLLQGP